MFGNPQRKLLGNEIGTNTIISNINLILSSHDWKRTKPTAGYFSGAFACFNGGRAFRCDRDFAGCFAHRQVLGGFARSNSDSFRLRGAADAWGDKVTIWIVPAVAAIIFAVLTAVSRYPHTFNYPVPITSENARRQYLLGRGLLVWLKAQICWLLAFVVRQQILVALGNAQRFSIELLLGLVVLMFGTVCVYLLKAYSAR